MTRLAVCCSEISSQQTVNTTAPAAGGIVADGLHCVSFTCDWQATVFVESDPIVGTSTVFAVNLYDASGLLIRPICRTDQHGWHGSVGLACAAFMGKAGDSVGVDWTTTYAGLAITNAVLAGAKLGPLDDWRACI